jgi:hypothetical protein
LFSKNKVQLYQKINGEYFDLTYDSVSVMMGFKVDYSILQSLIVGNQPYKKNNSRVIRENENIILKQQEGRINIDNMVGPNRKLKKLLVNDVPTSNKMTMDFEEFMLLNQVLFPLDFRIDVIDEFGCSGFDSVYVDAVPFIYIPSAFSPNGDKLNDTLEIAFSNFKISNFTLNVKKIALPIYHFKGCGLRVQSQ